MKHLKCIELFADSSELDRFPGDRLDRECCAPFCISIKFCQDNAGYVEALVKAGSDIDRFLACHGVGHEKYLPGSGNGLDLGQFVHQEVIDLVTAGRIEDDGIVAVQFGEAHRCGTDIDRFLVG